MTGSEVSLRAFVACCLNCDPSRPEDWPVKLIDRLLDLREKDGLAAFHREIRRVNSPRGQ